MMWSGYNSIRWKLDFIGPIKITVMLIFNQSRTDNATSVIANDTVDFWNFEVSDF